MQELSFPMAKYLHSGIGHDSDFHVVEFQVGITECAEWLGDELVLRCHQRGVPCRRVHRSDRSRVWIGFFDAAIAKQFRSAALRFGR